MSNSPLVDYVKISPNKNSPRNHKIDTITPHCVVGQLSVEQIGAVFAPVSRQASSNYGIGPDGRIGMYVEEKDRSWCSSNAANDHRAITIEIASDMTDPYAITDQAYKALVDLCVDICKRNDIKELKWKADKSLIGKPEEQNITVHRWFANKACPGDYIYDRLGQIADEVNARLNGSASKSEDDKTGVLYRVQVGAFSKKENAETMQKHVTEAGYDSFIVKVDDLYKVQLGAFKHKENATKFVSELKYAGFMAYVVTANDPKKSVDEIAKEVIKGLWGSGEERKKALTDAGYDYAAVQKKVNELLK